LKVLHIYRTYFPDPPGGLQEAIRQICLATKIFGIESKVFTLTPNPIPNVVSRPEAQVVRAKSWWAPASCDLGGFEAVKQYKELASWADVIHFHFPWPFADLLNLLVDCKKPKIMTYHSDIVRQKFLNAVYAPLMRHTMKSMDIVVATSPAYIETSPVLRFNVAPNRLRMIPLGIADHSKDASDGVFSDDFLVKWGLTEEPFALSLGVLRYYKGLHSLLNAASNVRGKIVIAGSGPQEQKLKAQAVELGLDNVVFVGQVTEDEKVVLLRNCYALVLPSHVRSEAFGMVLVEASMYTKPMVCCEIGSGTSYVNEDLVTGFVVPPDSPKSLSDALNKLIDDEVLAKRMGQAARIRYEQNFSEEALGKSYSNLYREISQK
jgi:rhamnosyl/mannosyltransferase